MQHIRVEYCSGVEVGVPRLSLGHGVGSLSCEGQLLALRSDCPASFHPCNFRFLPSSFPRLPRSPSPENFPSSQLPLLLRKIMRAPKSVPLLADEDYWNLEDLCVPLSPREHKRFTLCLWIYLVKNCRPGIVLRMVCSESKEERPFLTLDGDRVLRHHSWSDSSVSVQQTITLEKWVHLGCEVESDFIRLHIDGVMVHEQRLDGPVNDIVHNSLIFMGGTAEQITEGPKGYVHYVQVLPQPNVTNHYVKCPPFELALDGTTGASEDHELEDGGDGVWNVVGGKASCRRNFALDVVLIDALGRSVHKDMEVIALLVYADNGTPVEKPKYDSEAPLLTTFDGVEFPSTERAIKLVHGRASFKLKISQLSSKCDNRLFRVCFDSPSISKYPFLQVFSCPIRCVSRNRNSKCPSILLKRPVTDTSWMLEESAMEPSLAFINSSVAHAGMKCYPGQHHLKRTCITPEASRYLSRQSSDMYEAPHGFPNSVIKSLPTIADKDEYNHTGNANRERSSASQGMSSCSTQKDIPLIFDHLSLEEKFPESNEKAKVTGSYRSRCTEASINFFVFKYSLESIPSRGTFLRGVLTCWSDQELSEFAKRVSHVTSCEHNGHQIMIARNLVREGNQVWTDIVNDANPVPWDIAVKHVEKHFFDLSCSSKRHFSSQDKIFLKKLAKCTEHVSREDFDRLWYWIYPVSQLLLNHAVRKTWEIEEPDNILSMVSREEVEALLRSQDSRKPGTFLLRFVSTCSWPHPDAGGLIISYIGQDFRIHHKLLSLDSLSRFNPDDTRSLFEIVSAYEEIAVLRNNYSSAT